MYFRPIFSLLFCLVCFEVHNLRFSRLRAESIAGYPHQQGKINKDRIFLYWHGAASPVASNATKEGRRLNRRVTITLRGAR